MKKEKLNPIPISQAALDYFRTMEGFREKTVIVSGIPIHIVGLPGLSDNEMVPCYITPEFTYQSTQKSQFIMPTNKITGISIAIKANKNRSYFEGVKDTLKFLDQDGKGIGQLRDIVSEVEDELEAHDHENNHPSESYDLGDIPQSDDIDDDFPL